MSEATLVSALMMALLGGPNDLLDYIPSDAYWQAKGVAVAVEQMTAELGKPQIEDISGLITKLGSEQFGEREAAMQKILAMGPGIIPQVNKATESPESEIADRAKRILQQLAQAGNARSVRRLMAIRTLGELKDKKAVAALTPMLQDKEVFVAEYAQAAVASIEGKVFTRPVPDPKTRAADLAVLPAAADLVAQSWAHPLADPPLSAAAILAKVPLPKGDRPALQKELLNQIVQVAELLGNVRIDGATCAVGLSNRGEPETMVVIARGRYDAKGLQRALAQLAEAHRAAEDNTTDADGVPSITIDRHMTLLTPSDDRCVLVCNDHGEDTGLIKEVATGVKTGKGQIATSPVAAALAQADTTAPTWAAFKLPDGLKGGTPFNGIDALTATIRMQGQIAELKAVATGSDAKELARAADQFELFNDMAIGELANEWSPWRNRHSGKRPIAIRNIGRALKSANIKVEGKTATLTMTLDEPAISLGQFPTIIDSRGLDDDTEADTVGPPETTLPAAPPAVGK